VTNFSNLSNYLKSIPGFHTKRKIVVLESDDWGSIRMPSLEVYKEMVKRGFDAQNRYNQYDTLATVEDLSRLFEVLTSVKDSNGNYCVMTPMCLVANPDFKKIEETNFREYHYEPFTETLKRYPGCDRSIELWREGISSRIFIPEFHGREHLNVTRWMKALRNGDLDAQLAFRYKFWGYPKRLTAHHAYASFQAAFDFYDTTELDKLDDIIVEGLNLFRTIFGYNASCFTPPNGPLNRVNENTSAKNGIKYIQSARLLYDEPIGLGRTRTRFRYLGKRNHYDQVYLVRNCFFEPNESILFNWTDKCLRDIKNAFKLNKPAIVSSHRVNYIGALDIKNRDKGLKQLEDLLKGIIKSYPDAEFLTSSQLGRIITGNESQTV